MNTSNKSLSCYDHSSLVPSRQMELFPRTVVYFKQVLSSTNDDEDDDATTAIIAAMVCHKCVCSCPLQKIRITRFK